MPKDAQAGGRSESTGDGTHPSEALLSCMME